MRFQGSRYSQSYLGTTLTRPPSTTADKVQKPDTRGMTRAQKKAILAAYEKQVEAARRTDQSVRLKFLQQQHATREAEAKAKKEQVEAQAAADAEVLQQEMQDLVEEETAPTGLQPKHLILGAAALGIIGLTGYIVVQRLR